MKFVEEVGLSLRTRNIWLDFGTDPGPDMDPGSPLFHYCEIGLFRH